MSDEVLEAINERYFGAVVGGKLRFFENRLPLEGITDRFDLGITDVLLAQSRRYLQHEQMAVLIGIARVQSENGHRFSSDAIRAFYAEHGITPEPILRALGWGPRDRCMISGRVTHGLEDMPCTAGAALCALAKSGAN